MTMTSEHLAVIAAYKRDLPAILEGNDPFKSPMRISGWQDSLSLSAVMDEVSIHFGVKISDIKSQRRGRNISWPRQIFCYLARHHTDKTFAQIGNFVNRDHTTVMHAIKRVKEARRSEKTDRIVSQIEARLE